MAMANASEVLFTLLSLHGPAINCLVAFKLRCNAVLILCIPGRAFCGESVEGM